MSGIDPYMTTGHPDAGRVYAAELEKAKATIAQQAQMIEHLRGAAIPCYTAVDVATAAAQGFRDGVASVAKDALIGRIVFQYFDRMDDPAECDPLEKSVGEFLAAVCAAMSKEG